MDNGGVRLSLHLVERSTETHTAHMFNTCATQPMYKTCATQPMYNTWWNLQVQYSTITMVHHAPTPFLTNLRAKILARTLDSVPKSTF